MHVLHVSYKVSLQGTLVVTEETLKGLLSRVCQPMSAQVRATRERLQAVRPITRVRLPSARVVCVGSQMFSRCSDRFKVLLAEVTAEVCSLKQSEVGNVRQKM